MYPLSLLVAIAWANPERADKASVSTVRCRRVKSSVTSYHLHMLLVFLRRKIAFVVFFGLDDSLTCRLVAKLSGIRSVDESCIPRETFL